MLTHIHVKNMALIDEAEVDFTKGLNVLTGETGAGKSILIGSVGLALGKKASKDMIREGSDQALAELVFSVDDEECKKALLAMDIEPEEDEIIISRRLTASRSICKINGEIATAGKVRQAATLLLDIHGQHEHQSLLYPDKQLGYLDSFGQEETRCLIEEVAAAYKAYKDSEKAYKGLLLDEEEKRRQLDFLNFEVEEIENAALKEGEDEELEKQFKRMSNAQKIAEALAEVHELTGYDGMQSAGAGIGYALQRLLKVASLDEGLNGLCDSLGDIDSLLNDFNRELSDFSEELTFSEEDLKNVSERLDLINHLKAKYGPGIQDIQDNLAKKEEELDRLKHYEEYKEKLEKECSRLLKVLEEKSRVLSENRRKNALLFQEKLIGHLKDLNFNDVRFAIEQKETENFSANGRDSIRFMISTNPGEPMRELAGVVSGGELSRIMLGIRTMMAEKEHTETLIFDEIDTGISGRTAQKVAEKMALISRNCQVLCITHLPQIAAMADSHFEIEKTVTEGSTKTEVHSLSKEDSTKELARMLGGSEITPAVRENAREMKTLAEELKKELSGR